MTKNLKGGYKIVSLKGNDLTSESAFTIKGIYEELRDSYSKPILVTEIVIDDEKQQDAYAVVKKTEFGYTIEVYDYALTVTDEDLVSSVALPEITSIGEGLDLTDGELSASGGGGSKLYRHMFNISGSTCNLYFNYVTTKSEPFTSFKAVMQDWYDNITLSTGFKTALVLLGIGSYSSTKVAIGVLWNNDTRFLVENMGSSGLTSDFVDYSTVSFANYGIVEV